LGGVLVIVHHDISEVASCFLDRSQNREPIDYHGTLSWYQNFVTTCLDPGDEPIFFDLSDGAGRRTVLTMRLRRDGSGPMRSRTLASLTNYYSCWFAPHGLDMMPNPAGTIEDWGRALRRWRERPHRVRFDALDSSSAGFSALAIGLRRAGYWLDCYPQFGNWYLSVGDREFGSYWASRVPTLRHTVERKERALRLQHKVSIDVIAAPEAAGLAIALYQQVYAASWKRPEPYPRFIPGLIEHGLSDRSLAVGVLKVDGTPVATQIWIFFKDRATIFKLAHLEDFSRWSVGSILTRHLMERALSDPRVREIDFGRGDDPYKQLWLPYRRQRWGIIAYDPGTVTGLGHAMRNFGPKVLRWAVRRGTAKQG